MGSTGTSLLLLAYIDPGTGSFLIQMLLAGVAGAAGVLALYWKRLKVFVSSFRSSRRQEKGDADSTHTPEP